MKKFSIVLLVALSVLFLTSCVKPYTVEGKIIGKVFEPAHTHSMISTGRVIIPLTNADKWYVEILFTDKNNEAKTFYWGVTKEAYDAYKIGDKTPVNVEDTGNVVSWFIPAVFVIVVVLYLLVKLIKKSDAGIGESEEMDEIEHEEIERNETVSIIPQEKDKSKLFW